MDAAGCERNWAKHIPSGAPGDLCFGLLKEQYVPFWCAVALAAIAVQLTGRAWAGTLWPRMPSGLLARLRGKRSGAGHGDLESGLLASAAPEPRQTAPVHLAVEPMELVCAQQGLAFGLEAAGLAVMVAFQNRRRYGSSAVAVKWTGVLPQAVEVEMASPQMSFVALLKAADDALQAAQKLGGTNAQPTELPDVVLTWGAEPPAPGQWSLQRTGPGRVEVHGGGREELLSFKILFEACAGQPEGDVWQMAFVPEESLAHVQAWGSPGTDFAAYRDRFGRLRPVPQILADRRAAAQADALVGPGYRICYEELWRRAAKVEQAVHGRLGASRSQAVVVYMGRGEMIGPAILGVLQAGHHVVPVDVHWPLERAEVVATDSSSPLALVEPTSAQAWASLGSRVPEALLVDRSFFDAPDDGAGAGTAASVEALDEGDPAIVLFTSGSTGRPKGIVLSHGYVTALAAGRAECLRMAPETRTLAYHSPTWMPFIDYFFGPLLKGGCCLFLPEQSSHAVSPADLRTFALEHGATIIGFVPAVLDIFLEEGLPPKASRVCVGGAAVPAELCNRVVAVLPRNRDGSPGVLYTGYHGTEQGDVTQCRLSAPEDVQRFKTAKGVMGAGRPHAAQHCAVLDPGMRVAGIGAVGEICVAGPGLASGYLNMPEKTAETFLACEALGGARTIRTADLGLWTPAGNLEVVGRRDAMVKVRGARVELGEVEAAVHAHPDVRECVVVVRDDRLVAYVTPSVPGDLRSHCKEKLVAYMVPHVFEGLEELPRLANGKVNRKALPVPTLSTDGAETVMELDSLGKMRRITRLSASEDRILDNVRAILIAVVIQSHATPLSPGTGAAMLDVAGRPVPGEWGPLAYGALLLSRSGGWPSLAFLAGFDETRGSDAYALTYRELVFFGIWVLSDFNWSMWFLPAFVYMRIAFVAAHRAGLERAHVAVTSLVWLALPCFVDLYVGWRPISEGTEAVCPAECLCPFEAIPWAEDFAYYTLGWWNAGPSNSFVARGLFFIPCYWLGFYQGRRVMPLLTRITDDPSWLRRAAVALSMMGLYWLTFSVGQFVQDGFSDRCRSFWHEGRFVLAQVARNVAFYAEVLWASVLYGIFVAAAVPVHLKHLAKVCFLALIAATYTPCLLNLAEMSLQIRRSVPMTVAPVAELVWAFLVPFLYELVAGTVLAALLQLIVQVAVAVTRRTPAKLRQVLLTALGIICLICTVALVQPKWSSGNQPAV